MSPRQAKLVRSSLAGLAGMAAYGSWAAYANYDHGTQVAIRCALVQGGYSLALTFVMTLVTEWLHGALPGGALRGVVTTATVACALFITAGGINLLAGTPEVLLTILPGFVIGSAYTALYVAGLERLA